MLHFSVNCFTALTSKQISELIDRLVLKIEEQEGLPGKKTYTIFY